MPDSAQECDAWDAECDANIRRARLFFGELQALFRQQRLSPILVVGGRCCLRSSTVATLASLTAGGAGPMLMGYAFP